MDFIEKLLRLFRGNCATALALAGILSRAAVVASLASALPFAGVLSGAFMLGFLLLRLSLVLTEQSGAGN